MKMHGARKGSLPRGPARARERSSPAHWAVIVVVTTSVLWCCGGTVEHGGGSDGGHATDDSGSSSFDPTKLGQCTLGFLRQSAPTRACPWLADGRCYDTKEAACACICPTDRASVCWSSFPTDTSVTLQVNCA